MWSKSYTCSCLLFSGTQRTTSKLKIGHFRCLKKERINRGLPKNVLFFFFIRLVGAEKRPAKECSFCLCHNSNFGLLCGVENCTNTDVPTVFSWWQIYEVTWRHCRKETICFGYRPWDKQFKLHCPSANSHKITRCRRQRREGDKLNIIISSKANKTALDKTTN